jgi:hypothetical protein
MLVRPITLKAEAKSGSDPAACPIASDKILCMDGAMYTLFRSLAHILLLASGGGQIVQAIVQQTASVFIPLFQMCSFQSSIERGNLRLYEGSNRLGMYSI